MLKCFQGFWDGWWGNERSKHTANLFRDFNDVQKAKRREKGWLKAELLHRLETQSFKKNTVWFKSMNLCAYVGEGEQLWLAAQ